jgi:putative transposase
MDLRVHPPQILGITHMPEKRLPQRKSPRLQGFDYSTPGAYFVTICVQEHRHLLGSVTNGTMKTNHAGQMVEDSWQQIANKFPTVRLDTFVVMPNHMHGLIWLTTPQSIEPSLDTHAVEENSSREDHVQSRPSLSSVMQWFKSWTTAQYRSGVVNQDWTPFPGRLWQKSFYDHIVRHNEALNMIRYYIQQNPKRWSVDRYHPQPQGIDPVAAQIWRLLNSETNS